MRQIGVLREFPGYRRDRLYHVADKLLWELQHVAAVADGELVDLTPTALQSELWKAFGVAMDGRHARFWVVGCPECNADGNGGVRMSRCRTCEGARKVLVS